LQIACLSNPAFSPTSARKLTAVCELLRQYDRLDATHATGPDSFKLICCG
jgi:hypothetical protein